MRLIPFFFCAAGLVVGPLFSSEPFNQQSSASGQRHRSREWKAYNLVADQPDVRIAAAAEEIGCTWVDGTVWDKPLIETFCKTLQGLRPDAVVMDIGAQTGAFSLLAKFFPQSTWYAFEPLQEVIKVLHQNLQLNRIANVQVIPAAVGEMSGSAILQIAPREYLGLCTTGTHVTRFTPVGSQEVPMVSLDDFVEARGIKQVDLIKIDTEGAEYHILRGATRLLRRCRPILVLEYFDVNMQQCGVDRGEFDALLRSLGYSWHKVGIDDILCVPVQD
jgi:FkbM family methyltransferase